MWLTNLKVRIKKYPKGWVVERKKFIRWVHIISVSGIEKEPWYYESKDVAINEATKLLKWDLKHSDKIKK